MGLNHSIYLKKWVWSGYNNITRNYGENRQRYIHELVGLPLFRVGLPLFPLGLPLFASWESWTPVFKILVRALIVVDFFIDVLIIIHFYHFSYFSTNIYVGTQKNSLIETVLLSTQIKYYGFFWAPVWVGQLLMHMLLYGICTWLMLELELQIL